MAKRVYVDVALKDFSPARQEADDVAGRGALGADPQGSAPHPRRPGARRRRGLRALQPGDPGPDRLGPRCRVPRRARPAAAARARRRGELCGAGQALQRRHAGARGARRAGPGRRGRAARGFAPATGHARLRAATQRDRQARHTRPRCRRPDRHDRPQPAARGGRSALSAQGDVRGDSRRRRCRRSGSSARRRGRRCSRSSTAGSPSTMSRRLPRGTRRRNARASASGSTTSRNASSRPSTKERRRHEGLTAHTASPTCSAPSRSASCCLASPVAAVAGAPAAAAAGSAAPAARARSAPSTSR